MARFLHHFESCTFRNCPRYYLVLFWLLGFGAGGYVFRHTGDSIVSLMPLAAAGRLSIVSLYLSALLPFLCSAFAVFISKPSMQLFIGSIKAFVFAYVLCGVFSAYGQSGWLIRWLLLFTDSFACALLFGWQLRYISNGRGFSAGGLGFCTIFLALLVYADYYYISPLLRSFLS